MIETSTGGSRNGTVTYSVVVPVYNSEASLQRLNRELHEVMGQLGATYELIYVDDCSADGSWEVLRSLHGESSHVHIIRLAGNVGQLTALICGVHHAQGEHIITIDDDLEYDTFDIARLVEYYRANGYLIVYAMPKGKERKNLSYRLFFRVRNRILNFLLGKHHTEGFRVFNSKVVKARVRNIDMHLEALHKWLIDERFIGRLDVAYRQRTYGISGHGLLKKLRIVSHIGLDYLPSPLRPILYIGVALLASAPLVAWALCKDTLTSPVQALAVLSIVSHALTLIALGLLARFASTLTLRSKGRPDYLIAEQHPTI